MNEMKQPKVSDLANMLIRTNIICEEAWYDPAGYDSYVTMDRVHFLYDLLWPPSNAKADRMDESHSDGLEDK